MCPSVALPLADLVPVHSRVQAVNHCQESYWALSVGGLGLAKEGNYVAKERLGHSELFIHSGQYVGPLVEEVGFQLR